MARYIALIFLALTVDFTAVQAGALALAAVLAIPITHALKKAFDWNGGAALILAGAIAAGLAIAAMFSTGQAHSVQDVLLNISGVFGVSQAIFKIIVYGNRAVTGESSNE